MYMIRKYRCDFGHSWTHKRKVGADISPTDAVCPEGHPAVTCQEETPHDLVSVLFRCATRIVDPVRKQLVEEKRYWLVLQDRTGCELAESTYTYDWDDAARLARRFEGKDPGQALALWSRRPL